MEGACCHRGRFFAEGIGFDEMSENEKWKLVEAKISRSEIGREADVKHFLEFVRSWSGGLKDPWVLRDLDKYCKCLPEVRNIDAQTLGKLAKLDLGAAQGAVWRLACLKIAANPSEKALQVADVTAMGGLRHKPHILTAIKHMNESRRIMDDASGDANIDHTKLEKALDRLDMRLVKHATCRSRDFANMGDICFIILQDVVEAGGASACPPAWKRKDSIAKTTTTAASAAAAASTSGAILELTSVGPSMAALERVLSDIGCVVGSQCTHVQSGLVYEVVDISKDNVSAKGVGSKPSEYGGDLKLKVPRAEVRNTFKAFFKKAPQAKGVATLPLFCFVVESPLHCVSFNVHCSSVM